METSRPAYRNWRSWTGLRTQRVRLLDWLKAATLRAITATLARSAARQRTAAIAAGRGMGETANGKAQIANTEEGASVRGGVGGGGGVGFEELGTYGLGSDRRVGAAERRGVLGVCGVDEAGLLDLLVVLLWGEAIQV